MPSPIEYSVVDLSAEQVEEERRLFGGLADSVRALADACVRTTVDTAVVEEVRAGVEKLTARLTEQQIEGSFGVSVSKGGAVRGYGNAVVGLRNPVAVPLHIERSEEGRAWASFRLGAVYEGPPGTVHGGVCALLLDQLLGEAAAAGGAPGMTGTLTLRYRRPTPLGEVSGEAWVERVDGIKTLVRGVLRNAEGDTSVEAEGVFILPRWAREAMERHAFE